MRKTGSFKVILLAFMLVLVGVLSACGQAPANNAAQPAQEQPAAPAKTESSDEFITYQAQNGEVKIPKDLKRVVVLADSYVGDFLALGIKPIGITDHVMKNPYMKGKLDGIESVGDGSSVEKVLTMNPDLIVVFEGDKNLAELSKIAPTVAIPYGKKTFREQLQEFGKMTGREDKANEWIASWDKKIAELKPKVQAAVGDKTVAILQPYAKGIYAFGHNYGRGGEIIYGEFQLKAPAATQKAAIDSGTGWAEVSLETLPDFAGDYIFTSAWSGDDADPEAVYGSNVWKGLPAVKNNKVFQLDRDGSYFNDPISLEAQLDFIVEKLTQN
ncbi:iron-hydroxamate ABC transporter substrate-binding protein [Brevibacillus agri]|uniref:iron-hydroxamate ABC transporter substrate-binding protein n=1 Tax=Brevibacillus agri TaxID=51101 RepID=UPI0002A51B44|nr:iron-hydroxamate ABC transporter substrate-binding protein [Brevibacillus agri]ELK41749.1 ferrichrome ABC transporter substrate-binding protein FhuD [Brevibacillus agri BAB-2500]MCG5253230.1 iron-hydroxamate ABC transporter substrate-binding protein [Brevibacillus agri]MED1642593.1 iron-hydroxamate ABC transporter substrate-binding protein [Brevibacillus agri]MED1653151.1 iron-hydroxamate ABC transporter substrate-binding protein [Brevibacillus agri]MED1686836.1 iron-hydroxamate ABC transpo